MASQVAICNLALSKFGDIAIQAITDETKEARACRVLWDLVRDGLIESYPWRFALKRVALGAALAAAPEFGFDYKYTLPAGCLRVWELYDSDSDWTIEGNEFYTSDEEPQIRYIAQITDSTQFNPSFVKCFATNLAAELCPKLTDNPKLRLALLQELEVEISKAYKTGAIEGNPPMHKDQQGMDAGNFPWQTEGR